MTKPSPVKPRKRLTWTPYPTNYGSVSRKFLKANGLPWAVQVQARPRRAPSVTHTDKEI